MSRIVLHIDRLVLRGVAGADAAAVSAAFRAELAARLAAGDGLAALLPLHGREAVRAGRTPVADGSGPGALGRAAAGRILRGVPG